MWNHTRLGWWGSASRACCTYLIFKLSTIKKRLGFANSLRACFVRGSEHPLGGLKLTDSQTLQTLCPACVSSISFKVFLWDLKNSMSVFCQLHTTLPLQQDLKFCFSNVCLHSNGNAWCSKDFYRSMGKISTDPWSWLSLLTDMLSQSRVNTEEASST